MVQKRPQQRFVAIEQVELDLRQFVVTVRHERVTPVDDAGKPSIFDEDVTEHQVTMEKYPIISVRSIDVVVNLCNQS